MSDIRRLHERIADLEVQLSEKMAELTRLAAENAKLDHMVKEGAALFLEAASELTRLAHENDTLAKELENATKLFKQLSEAEAEIARLQGWLEERDAFIVHNDLWAKFVGQFPLAALKPDTSPRRRTMVMTNGNVGFDEGIKLVNRAETAEKERDAAKAEIARLTADFNDCNSERYRWNARAEIAEAEIARLRMALTDTTGALAKFVNTKAKTREPYETALSAYDRGIAALKPDTGELVRHEWRGGVTYEPKPDTGEKP